MERRKFNIWWVFGGFLIVAMIAIAVFLNSNYNHDAQTDNDTIDIDNGDIKIDWDNYPSYTIQLSGNYTITAPGTYYISGDIDNGGISVRLNDNGVAKLVLENVSIKNPSGPAISCVSGDDLVIESKGSNYLEDGASYDSSLDEDIKGAIYSKADLTLIGDGTLKILANHQDGIVSKDDLKINGGEYDVTATDDGIRGKDSVYIVDGKINISAKGDGIKTTNEKEASKGFILLAGGDVEIQNSYEGLEARKIIIDSGKLSIYSSDDGINAGEEIRINDGDIYVNATGDGIDSNGDIYINGGTTIVDGPTNSGNGALDSGNTITMNGGTAIAVGASGMAENLGSSSTIYNASIFFDSTLSKKTNIEIKDASGGNVISFISAKTFSHMAVGTPLFKLGETYIIYINNIKYDQFTISDIVTTVGTDTSMTPGRPGGAMVGPAGPRGER